MSRILRRGAFAVLPLLALATSLPSQAGGPTGLEKLDGSLRGLTLRAADAKVDPRAALTLVPLFIKTTDPLKTAGEVRTLGGTVNTFAGDILTARVPMGALNALAAFDHVARLEGAIRIHKKLDKVRAAMHVDEVHAGNKGTASLKGTGVVVGIVDYGLDLDHAAFKKADGTTRVISLWDQTTTGTAPTGFTYGNECTGAILTAGTCTETSTSDHGTHVTGIAAGGPVITNTYEGIAPEADIAFVNLGTPDGALGADDALTTSVCDATNYIFTVAAAANKPAVVNLSLGAHFGPHDGSSLADQCLDNLTGAGKIIVAAAGNEGEGSITPSTQATSMGARTFVHTQIVPTTGAQAVRFLPSKHDDGSVDLDGEIWFDDPTDVTVRIGAVVPGHQPVFTTVASTTKAVTATLLTPTGAPVAGTTYGPVTIAGATTTTGQRSLAWHVADKNGDKGELNDVQWILEITGASTAGATGKVDGYIDTTDAGGFITNAAAPGALVDSNQTIGYPAIAKNVLAVGSYVTRNSWTPADGTLGIQQELDKVTGQQVVLGDLSGFSSHGPPRTATVVTTTKPDITAPGEIVASALNSKSTPDPKNILVAAPNGYVLIQGTSMASPAAAGVIALMLQKTPTLTVDQIRTTWSTASDAPSGVTLPSSAWGLGKLDALTSLGGSENFDAGAPDAGGSSTSSSSSGEISTSSSTSSSTGGISSSSGAVDAGAASSGNADSGAGGGGGCSTSSNTTSGAAGALILGIAAMFSRRRRRA